MRLLAAIIAGILLLGLLNSEYSLKPDHPKAGWA